MSQCVLVLCLLLLHLTTAVGDDCSRDGMEGCRVDDGHAVCESEDLTASIRALPTCTTNINFLLLANPNKTEYYNRWTNLKEVNFSHLKNLTELSIYSSRDNHTQVGIKVWERAALRGLSSLQIFRLRLQQISLNSPRDYNKAMYNDLKSLKMLDLTRAQDFGLSAAKHVIGNNSSIKTLILKNIQEIRRDLIYTPSIDLGYFICGGHVQHLDLSYNDITYITVSLDKCNSKLQFLNLDHNIIASIHERDTDNELKAIWSLLSMLPSLRTLSINATWQSEEYQEGLWHDDPHHTIEGPTDSDIGHSRITELLQGTSFGFLAKYDFWVEDIMKHCGNITTGDMLRCRGHIQKDICAFFQCLLPQTFDKTFCPKDDIFLQLSHFARQACGYYRHCDFNIPIPLPPQLRSIFMQEFGKYFKFVHDNPQTETNALCIHTHNDLEVFDIASSNLAYMNSLPGSRYISGLDKLKYFNMQGCKIHLEKLKLAFTGMESKVTELHVGGNTMGPNNTVPVELLQAHKRLSVLNLSNANLVGFEDHVFMNLKQLSVLDLSHNRLRASALASVDFSKTSIRSLNLSYNSLTTVPDVIRNQLSNKQDLELSLSYNSFLCSCDNLAFLQWVQSSSSSITFHRAGDYECADSPGYTIYDIDVDSLRCDWYWVQPAIAVGSSLALASLILFLVYAYKKRWTIRNLIFRLQERLFSPPEDTATTPYRYDAFVLYSSIPDDRLWVHFKLVQELENVYGFKLCIHHRDFLAGCDIVDNIEQAIRSSRKVLVVMSENFMRSEWCVEEVHMTSSVDRNKFIVIMYRDVMLSAAPMPVVVRRLLESRTYIEWDENPHAQRLFWKKLRRALYSNHMGLAACEAGSGSLEMIVPRT